MPVTVDTTVGGPDANSFASVTEYRAYWGAHLFSTAALAATDDVIGQALITVGNALNALIIWNGSAASDTQRMSWPRNGMVTRNGFPIDSTTNPEDLKNAQCEWAGQYISKNLFATDAIKAQNIASAKAGPVAVSYKNPNTAGSVETMAADFRKNLPDLAWASTEVPEFVRNLLVSSWYVRPGLQPAIIFEGHR